MMKKLLVFMVRYFVRQGTVFYKPRRNFTREPDSKAIRANFSRMLNEKIIENSRKIRKTIKKLCFYKY